MGEYSASITWLVIIGLLFTTGILYMMLNPLIDSFLIIGDNAGAGADPVTMGILGDVWRTWIPVTAVFGCILYGWRKSSNRVV